MFIGYINKRIKGEIAAIYNNDKDEKLLTLNSLKGIIEEKLKNVVKLSEDIQELLEEETDCLVWCNWMFFQSVSPQLTQQ